MAGRKLRSAGSRKLTRDDYRLLAEFRRVIRQFFVFSEDAARRAGITPQQHRALLAIKAFDGQGLPTITDLAAQLGIRHHSAVGLVDRLGRARLVARMDDPSDRRRTALGLTAHGEKMLLAVSGANRAELRRLTPLLKPLVSQLSE